ncbi:MAG TPA: hypothetical protein PLZ38_02935 [Spirochaetota bacterium]|jgi:hypothetical protein|nr:hypothetical protein [Spirochaetota bacterium]HOR92910.1 hypothetical protein [Spirochaetota bacterium]HPD03980.1 hypothetical protein [Spirochaetota bacterium]HPK45201.1 hypothetical protein [Spirochaetota bacterium]HRR59693.1 hypothetical protein [Spirochaetota bacterium]
MRILIHLLLISFIVACGTSKPLTPQQALQQLSDSYTSGDMAKVAQLLSTNSKKRIQNAIQLIGSMNQSQLSSFAKHYRISAASLKNLTIPQYLSLQKTIASIEGDDVILQALQQPVTDITINNAQATVTVYNGMTLIFVKEGAYWYFEYE